DLKALLEGSLIDKFQCHLFKRGVRGAEITRSSEVGSRQVVAKPLHDLRFTFIREISMFVDRQLCQRIVKPAFSSAERSVVVSGKAVEIERALRRGVARIKIDAEAPSAA